MRICLALLLPFFISITAVHAQDEIQSSTQTQQWILEAIKEMPNSGGYKLTNLSAQRLRDAFIWRPSTQGTEQLLLNSQVAAPSYCTTATYQIFYKVLQKYWAWSKTTPSKDVLDLLKPDMENDGERIWGRWNSNGPGTAKLFTDSKLGQNFDDIHKAIPGDFLKMFWNDHIGKRESGHSVMFLGLVKQDGEEYIKFWSSNSSTHGYSVKMVPRKDATRTLFSRITNPKNIETIVDMDEDDSILAEMNERDSTWAEVSKLTGLNH
jgi:hypothetical protein